MQPAAQVGANRLHFGAPDLRNGGRKIALRLLGLRLQNRVEPFQRVGQVLAVDRRQAGGGKFAQQFELHPVIEIAAIRRVHALNTFGPVRGTQAENAAQREAVRTAGVLL